MNERVRTYLIETARQRDKFVFYSDVVRDCDLDIDFSNGSDKKKFSKILGAVSAFEHSNGRPLISALAIYKDDKDHGPGFYKIASQLGFGNARTLQSELFGFTEATKCRAFWQNEENYVKYASATQTKQKSIADLFTTLLEKDKYAWTEDWKEEYVSFVEDVKVLRRALTANPTWHLEDPRLYVDLSEGLQNYEDFMWNWLKEKSNGISSRGQSVLSDDNFYRIIGDDAFKVIAKTVILDPTLENYNLLNDWWFGNNLINNRPLLINRAVAACNPEVLSSTVHNAKFWTVIDVARRSFGFEFAEDHHGNWFTANVQLTAWLDRELAAVLNEKTPNVTEQLIWRNIFVWLIYQEFSSDVIGAPNTLVKREKPQNGFENIPESRRDFRGMDTDFVAKARDQKDLGDAGEELVKQYEIRYLTENGLHEKAQQVKIVKNGEGYDVLSFDANANKKFIEVKTTTGNELAQFYLSDNEVAFMRLNKPAYSIYRVYNYDEENNSGEFFEIRVDVESQLLMEPTQYKVLIKKENII